MQMSRRHLLGMLPLGLVAFFVAGPNGSDAQAGWRMNDKIEVSIKVQDAAGRPIAFVTVWKFVRIDAKHVAHPKLNLTMEDLWRATLRYQETAEFAIEYGERPLPEMLVPTMGDQRGQVIDVVDYQSLTGSGNEYRRPDPLAFGYTFSKRGYRPARVDFLVSKGKDHVDAVVTLERDPGQELRARPYLETYERVRHELSDTAKNREMTTDNLRRLEGLREELELAARQAIDAGDTKSAARIFVRIRYMPELAVIDGRIAGFKQSNLSSDRSERALQRAYELDPDNLFVWMNTYGKRVSYPPGASDSERIRINLQQIEQIIASGGESVWPIIYQRRASSYAALGEYAKARKLFLEAASLEPKHVDWEQQISKLKQDMHRSDIPVPADW